jgi:hypothetical protein
MRLATLARPDSFNCNCKSAKRLYNNQPKKPVSEQWRSNSLRLVAMVQCNDVYLTNVNSLPTTGSATSDFVDGVSHGNVTASQTFRHIFIGTRAHVHMLIKFTAVLLTNWQLNDVDW